MYPGVSAELGLALAVALILATLLVPLPAAVIDVGLALNLACSVTMLVAALGAREVLSVSAFPTALLVTTLFRLALNVSSTRLALSEGHAGRVIEAFGEFVVRGDYVVGAVVFAILTLIQFLVVTKGAERVAEVAARFTLDAMPGKQMAIDADLRAGAIDQDQARARRRVLERESQMFGAMDGAMKFVKGDVLAGLVIVLVNLAGGTAIGMLQREMSAYDAASIYALIAIGDGLASQIPSLAVTIAAGLVVTRVASEEGQPSLGSELVHQFFGRPSTLAVVAGMCAVLALVPGMPAAPFLFLAAVLAAPVLLARSRTTRSAPEAATDGPSTAARQSSAESGEGTETPLTLELAIDLTPSGGAVDLLRDGLEPMRERLFRELGVRIPGLCVRVGAGWLPKGGYRLLLDEVPIGQGVLAPGRHYASCAPSELAYLGATAEAAREPGTDRELALVAPDQVLRVQATGVRVRPDVEVLCDHLASLLRRRLPALLGVQEVQGLLDGLAVASPVLVREVGQKVPLALLTEVLRRLVAEEVPIRPLRPVLEALLSPSAEGDAAALAEHCRAALRATLSHRHAPAGSLYAWLVDPGVEELLRSQLRGAAVEPEDMSRVLEAVQRIGSGGRAILLASADVRPGLRRLCESAAPEVSVLTYAELDPALRVHPLGRLAA